MDVNTKLEKGLDLLMLHEADEAVVVVGHKAKRSRRVDRNLWQRAPKSRGMGIEISGRGAPKSGGGASKR